MRKISLRRLLSKLTVLALSAAPAAATAAPTAIDDDLDSDVTIDRERLDLHDASLLLGRNLAQALAEMQPLAATHLATTWALSADPLRRAAIASALEWVFPLLGDGAITDYLSTDPDPVIRAACARAAWMRRATGGDPGVLARLVDDPDPHVRAIANHAR